MFRNQVGVVMGNRLETHFLMMIQSSDAATWTALRIDMKSHQRHPVESWLLTSPFLCSTIRTS